MILVTTCPARIHVYLSGEYCIHSPSIVVVVDFYIKCQFTLMCSVLCLL